MRNDRISYDFTNYPNPSSISNSRLNGSQTPRNKQRAYQNNNNNTSNVNNNATRQPINRRSVSPIRYQPTTSTITPSDRISSSPLRVPLQQAISRCVRDRSIDKSASRRTLNKSSRLQQGSFIVENIKKISYQEQLQNKNIKGHSQTLKFIKKYFDLSYTIPTQQFISRILQQYGNLWDNQNLQQLLQDFTYKVHEIFGVDGIDPKYLIIKTKNDGMLGLIMMIFKELKQEQSTRNSNYTSFSRNPQVMSINKSFQERLGYNYDNINNNNNNINGNNSNFNTSFHPNIETIKNVVQQFMQSMYQCMQTQIYNKFNIQMRRMVLKYRQAEKIIKKVNQKITTHADFFDLEDKLRKQKKYYQERLNEENRNIQKLEKQLEKEREVIKEVKKGKGVLQEQNKRLKENMQKLQNLLINKALQGNTTSSALKDSSLSRYTSSNAVFTDRTQQYTNMNNISSNNNNINPLPLNLSNISCNNTMPILQQQPFQIKIDTHFIQKQVGPPSTYTTTMFGNSVGGVNGVNNGSGMNGFTTPMTPISVSPIKIKDESNKENSFLQSRYSYSPYQSRFVSGARLY